MKLSAVLIVKNAEKTLARALDSIKDQIDEMVIVDTGSTDRTCEIASTYTSCLYRVEWEYDFAKARNQALQYATGDYRLVIDADEYVQAGCDVQQEARSLMQKGKNWIGKVQIRSSYLEQDHTRSYAWASISRLLPRDVFFTGRIHEQIAYPDLPRCQTGIILEHDGYEARELMQEKSERNISLLRTYLDDDLHPKERISYYYFQLAREFKRLQQWDQAQLYFKQAYEHLQPQDAFVHTLIVESIYNSLRTKNKADLDYAAFLVSKHQTEFQHYADFWFATGIFLMDWIRAHPEDEHLFPQIERCYQKCLAIGENSQGSWERVEGTGSYKAAYNLSVLYQLTGRQKEYETYHQLYQKMKSNFS